MSAPAIVLLAHGSPDPDWTRPVMATRDALAALAPDSTVVAATLGPQDETSLDRIIATLVAGGNRTIVVTALFLSAGGRHVKHDVPQTVATLAAQYPTVRIKLAPGALGDDPEVSAALASAAHRAVLALSE